MGDMSTELIKEIRYEGVDWIHLAQDTVQWRTLVNTIMNFRIFKKAKNLLTTLATISLSREILPPRVNVNLGTSVQNTMFKKTKGVI
jgi:hypothetical protein